MTETNTTITVHTRERMVIRNIDALDLRCGNCGASVDLQPPANSDICLVTTDRTNEPNEKTFTTQNASTIHRLTDKEKTK